MLRNLARLNPLQARKELLVATLQVQRAEILADARRARSVACRVADRARRRVHGVTLAAIGIGLVATWSTVRRSDDSARYHRPGLLHRALPLLRFAVSLWISSRVGNKI